MNTRTLLLLILLLLTAVLLQAQKTTKYTKVLNNQIDRNGLNENYSVWIFFKDKGTDLKRKLQTSKTSLTEASIKRRKKLFKNEDYVTLYDIPVETSYISQITPLITKIRHQSKWLNAISVEVNGEQLKHIEAFDFVEAIDVIRVRKYGKELPVPSTDPDSYREKTIKNTQYNLNYGSSITQLEQINVPFVHDMGYTGNGIIICVLDSGFNNLEHQSFDTMNILDSYDFVNDDNNVDDEGDMGNGNHGTMTLSTIGGFFEGELIGPAYGASYLLAKTENTDSETQVEEDNWVAGAEWAEALGAEITSTSLGYIDFDDGSGYDASELDGNTATITIAADIMASLGVLVVNSAGNSGSGTTTIGAPADGNEVLAVGAVDSNGIRTSFSSVGPTGDGRIKPEVMAMGAGVKVAETSGNSYTTASGTSFSCPLTAGAAALVWEMVPTASNMEIFEALKMTADNASSPNNEYGWGIIDVYAAYQYFTPKITTTPLNNTEDYSGPYEITAEITSNTALTSTPILYYRVDGGAWISESMTNSSGDTYTASIPGTGIESVYDYYIIAENAYALVSMPLNAPTDFYSFSTIVDTEAPQISHNPIAEYYVNLWENASIFAILTDNIGIDYPNSYVEWKKNGATQVNLNFVFVENDEYKASFPNIAMSVGDLIEYRLVIKDVATNSNTSYFPASGFQNFEITDIISFEQNQFSHNWLFTGESNWFVTSSESQDGTYAAQSGNIGHAQNTALELDFTTDVTGDISFYKKVSSEGSYDYLKFYINDVLQEEWSGEAAWSEETFSVSPGSYHLKWEYAKDGSVSNGSDAAWIDAITLPNLNSIGIDETQFETLTLFPNPANNIFNIHFSPNESINIEIFDLTGKQLQNIKNTKKRQIDLTGYSKGFYLVKISHRGQQIVNKLLLK